jgi:phosphohistidine phosphatase SixA
MPREPQGRLATGLPAPSRADTLTRMPTTTLYLARHAKAADRFEWDGLDRERPLTGTGRRQAAWMAGALAGEPLVVVAASPWLRCVQTAEAVAEAAGLEVVADPRLGYDEPDMGDWVAETLEANQPGALVAVGHGDLLPNFLIANGLLRGMPSFRTGSVFKVPVSDGRLGPVTYIDRAELRQVAERG